MRSDDPIVLSVLAAGLLMASGCVVGGEAPAKTTANPATRTVKAQIWADNWFTLYSGNTLFKEDSAPYRTERSFNTEAFSFSLPLPAQLSVIIKDYT